MKNSVVVAKKSLIVCLTLLTFCQVFFVPAAYASRPFGTYLGQFNTVAAFSNGGGCLSNCTSTINGVYIGEKWQCVEYVRRYYYTIFNTDLASLYLGNAEFWYANGPRMGLTQYVNGGEQRVSPQPGDILCSEGGTNGHIAIVKGVSNGKVYTVQQNFQNEPSDTDKALTLTINNGRYVIGNMDSNLPVTGWLRKQRQMGNSNVKWHPDGTLLRDNTGTVWLIEDGERRGVPDDFTFAKYGFSWWRIINASPDEISCFRVGPSLQPTRKLLRSSGGAIYLKTDRGQKRLFASMDVFNGLGYSMDQVTLNADAEIAACPDDPREPVMYSPLPNGTLIQVVPNGAVYLISNSKKRRLDLSVSDFQNAGWGFDQVVRVSATAFDSIPELSPINSTHLNQCAFAVYTAGVVEANPSFESAASISPNTAVVNQAMSVTTTVRNLGGAASDLIVDTEIYNSSNQRVHQSFTEYQSFGSNQTKTFTSSPWTPTLAGQYTIKTAVFNNSWTVNYYWNDSTATFSVGSGSTPATNYTVDIWWPAGGSQVTGTQPFQAIVSGLSLSEYNLFWQVDGGQLNLMMDNFQNYPHKESLVDLSGWTWRGTGPYTINFVARDASGNTLAQRAVNISVVH